MTTGRMFKELRDLCGYFVKEGGVIVRPTEGRTRTGIDLSKLSEERIIILYNLFNLIFNTDIVSDEVREYVFNRDITAASIAEKINASGKREVTEKQVAAKLQYEKSKLEKELGADIVYNTTHHLHADGEKEFIEKWYEAYKETINRLTVKKSDKEGLLNNLVVKIDQKEVCEAITGEEFQSMVDVLQDLLIVSCIKKLELLSKEQIGYLNYLLSDIKASDSEAESINNARRASIKELLSFKRDDVTIEDMVRVYDSCMSQALAKFGSEESGVINETSENLVERAESQLTEDMDIDDTGLEEDLGFTFDNQ